MKIHKIIIILFSIPLILLQYSCQGDRSCECEVTNLTAYKINVLKFGGLQNDYTTISIDPYKTSETFTLDLEYTIGMFDPGPPVITIRVESYSDSINTYTNKTGSSYGIKDLSETRINKFKVELNPENKDGNDKPFLVTRTN